MSSVAVDRISLSARNDLGLLRVQIFDRDSEAAGRLEAALGFAPPGAGQMLERPRQNWCPSAPGEWVIVTPAGELGAVKAELSAALTGEFAVISEIGDSRVIFELVGEGLRGVLARGSTLDFHPRSFSQGDCRVTRFAGVPVMLVCEEDRMLLLADISLQDYLAQWFAASSGRCQVASGPGFRQPQELPVSNLCRK